ncbi:MAG: response regulator [Mariprofundaceae bacterium]
MIVERAIKILMADDDEDDRMFAEDALEEARFHNVLHTVEDGVELMDYLCHRGEFSDVEKYPLPDLILLDLNMPRKDGREALSEIKAHPDAAIHSIPIVILTTSDSEADVQQAYDLGVNSYITKPVTFDGLVDVMKTLKLYWFQTVRLPDRF